MWTERAVGFVLASFCWSFAIYWKTMATSKTAAVKTAMKFLTQQEAIALDQDLFKTFPVENLMELAGLAVAQTVSYKYPPHTFPRVLVVAGPGNNGGDGLVAARHLYQFRYSDVTILIPKLNSKPMFLNMVAQCKDCNSTIIDTIPDHEMIESSFDVVLDCIFGFSFKGGNGVRSPFDKILSELVLLHKTPIVSVDVPSGWDVEMGRPADNTLCLEPETLISLTAPKITASKFTGYHFLGGRFVPPTIAKKYGITIPEYESPLHQFADITGVSMETQSKAGEL
jgi:NAD(P)H-hydrate epimerase